jgi:hypothetical protein
VLEKNYLKDTDPALGRFRGRRRREGRAGEESNPARWDNDRASEKANH